MADPVRSRQDSLLSNAGYTRGWAEPSPALPLTLTTASLSDLPRVTEAGRSRTGDLLIASPSTRLVRTGLKVCTTPRGAVVRRA